MNDLDPADARYLERLRVFHPEATPEDARVVRRIIETHEARLRAIIALPSSYLRPPEPPS